MSLASFSLHCLRRASALLVVYVCTACFESCGRSLQPAPLGFSAVAAQCPCRSPYVANQLAPGCDSMAWQHASRRQPAIEGNRRCVAVPAGHGQRCSCILPVGVHASHAPCRFHQPHADEAPAAPPSQRSEAPPSRRRNARGAPAPWRPANPAACNNSHNCRCRIALRNPSRAGRGPNSSSLAHAAMTPQTWSEWLRGLLSSLRPPPQPGSHEAHLEALHAGEGSLYLTPGADACQRGASREFREEAQVWGAACCRRRRPAAAEPAGGHGSSKQAGQRALCVLLVTHLGAGALLDKELNKPAGQRDEELLWKLRIDFRTIQLKNKQVGGGWRRRRALARRSLLCSWVISLRIMHAIRSRLRQLQQLALDPHAPLQPADSCVTQAELSQFKRIAAAWDSSTRQCCAAAQWAAQRVAASWRALADFKEQEIVQVAPVLKHGRCCPASRARCAASPALPPEPLPCCCLVSPSLPRPSLPGDGGAGRGTGSAPGRHCSSAHGAPAAARGAAAGAAAAGLVQRVRKEGAEGGEGLHEAGVG